MTLATSSMVSWSRKLVSVLHRGRLVWAEQMRPRGPGPPAHSLDPNDDQNSERRAPSAEDR